MIILIAIVMILQSVPAWANNTTYYVERSTGSNSDSGLTEALAFLTIKHCVENAAILPGDQCLVKNGTYPEGFTIKYSGTMTAPIQIKNFPGHAPSVTCTTPTNPANRIQWIGINGTATRVSWVVLEGFEITNCYDGMNGYNLTDVVIRRNNIHHNTGQGIIVTGTRVTIDRNIINHNGDFAGCAGGGTCIQHHGLYVRGTNWTITRNIIIDNLAYGLQIAGYGFSASTDAGADIAGATGWIIAHNVFAFQNHRAGIVFWDPNGGDAYPVQSNIVDNNIFYQNSQLSSAAYAIDWLTTGPNNLVRNNAFYATAPGGTTKFAHADGGAPSDYTESGSVNADPLMVSSSDFSLTASSPAINAGRNMAASFNGAAPDIGAHETFSCVSSEVGMVAANRLIITCTNNVHPPVLPATGITGITLTQNGAPVTVSSCDRSGTNLIDCTLGSSITGGTTLLASYTPGNLTDSACIGSCTTGNQVLHTFSSLGVTNNVSGASSATLTQTHFRFHDLRGTEAAPVVKPYPGAAVDTSISVVPRARFRLRLKVACTIANCDPLGMTLRYSLNGGAYTLVPENLEAGNIELVGMSDPDIPSSGTPTTEQLTSDHVTNVACAIVRSTNAVPNVDLSQNSETECEYSVGLDTDVTPGDTYDFRLYNQNGSPLSDYTVTPRATVVPMAAGGGM